MASLSTHVIDAAGGGPLRGVAVSVRDAAGLVVGGGISADDGRVAALAAGLATGSYRISWETGGSFLSSISATVELSEDRHYHIPLLVSDVTAITYLGA